MLKEMKVAGITVDPFTNTPIVILKDLEEKEVLPIWIGLLEASSIATALENVQTPRPMTSSKAFWTTWTSKSSR